LLSYIIYNHYQPESHGSHSTAASGDSLISRSLADVDSDGPPGVHDGHAITLIDVLLLAHRGATRAALLVRFEITVSRTDAAAAASVLSDWTRVTGCWRGDDRRLTSAVLNPATLALRQSETSCRVPGHKLNAGAGQRRFHAIEQQRDHITSSRSSSSSPVDAVDAATSPLTSSSSAAAAATATS